MVVLIDMDGVLASFDQRVLSLLSERLPTQPLPREDDRAFPLSKSFEAGCSAAAVIHTIMHERGFFATLEPIEGALQAAREMLAAGIDVRICSAPLSKSMWCAQEKIEWVKTHLGQQWVDRLILTRDKTFVRGDLLIDDAPSAKGSGLSPVWEHVYFDQPYNRPGRPGVDSSKRRLHRWADWQQIVPITEGVCKDSRHGSSSTAHEATAQAEWASIQGWHSQQTGQIGGKRRRLDDADSLQPEPAAQRRQLNISPRSQLMQGQADGSGAGTSQWASLGVSLDRKKKRCAECTRPIAASDAGSEVFCAQCR